jgi:hypothetical protein
LSGFLLGPCRLDSAADTFPGKRAAQNRLWHPMPVYGGGGEKCFICAKTVYAAEKVSANGWTFHKARVQAQP